MNVHQSIFKVFVRKFSLKEIINMFVTRNSKKSDKSDFYENVINLLLPKYKKICDKTEQID